MSTKPGSMPVLELPIPTAEPIISKLVSFSRGLKKLSDWPAKYQCSEVCMESTGKYWIPAFSILEKAQVSVVLAHLK